MFKTDTKSVLLKCRSVVIVASVRFKIEGMQRWKVIQMMLQNQNLAYITTNNTMEWREKE